VGIILFAVASSSARRVTVWNGPGKGDNAGLQHEPLTAFQFSMIRNSLKRNGFWIISLFSFILILVTGCTPTVESYSRTYGILPGDHYKRLASIEGFRVEMTAKRALAIANENGFQLNTQLGNQTLEDVINGEDEASVFLRRVDSGEDLEYQIKLDFTFGRIKSVRLEIPFQTAVPGSKEQAEFVFNRFLKMYPFVIPNGENAYLFVPNERARFSIYLIELEDLMIVSVTATDWNFAVREALEH
jgi:hypothetical protein